MNEDIIKAMKKLRKELVGHSIKTPNDFWHPVFGLWSEMTDEQKDIVRKEFMEKK